MSAPAFPRYAFVILGMHRSGTSALAGVLARYGADSPKTPMRPTEDNPAGYYESTPVKVLNDRILDSAGTSWDDWTRIGDAWYSGPRAAALKTEARSVLSQEFGTSPLFVFKDPRISRLWPFWRDVLEDMGITPIPILMLRDAEEVALSLLRRDRIPLGMGRLVWLRHQLDAEQATRGAARVIVTYDEILTDRSKFLSDLETVCGFAMPRRSDQSEAQVRQFIDPQLRRFSPANRSEPGSGPDVFREAHQLLREVDTSASAPARLDAIGGTLADLSGLVFGLAAPARDMARDLLRTGSELAAMKKETHELTEERDLLLELVEEKAALVEAALAARAQFAKDAAGQAETLQRLQAEMAALAKTAMAEREKAARDAAALAETKARAQTEIERLLAENISMQTEMGRWADVAAKREALLVQQNAAEVVKERERILNEFYQSRSWKVSAPVRWVGRAVKPKTGP